MRMSRVVMWMFMRPEKGVSRQNSLILTQNWNSSENIVEFFDFIYHETSLSAARYSTFVQSDFIVRYAEKK